LRISNPRAGAENPQACATMPLPQKNHHGIETRLAFMVSSIRNMRN
jgi:hypothetical protein